MNVPDHPRPLALLGDPVAHSYSPHIVNAACREAGVNGIYVALRCDGENLEGLIRGIARGGGGGNVTLPHKQRAARILDVPTYAVRRSGACNTFWADDDGVVHGDNTDVVGLQRAVEHLCGSSAEGMRVLILGAGGAARAVLLGLLEDGAERITVWNRTVERARTIARRIGGARTRVAVTPADVEDRSYDLIVNATTLGLGPRDESIVQFERLDRVDYVLDLVCGREPTPLMRAAEAVGIPAADGREMLVQQAAAAFEHWWGVPAPVETMRAALPKLSTDAGG